MHLPSSHVSRPSFLIGLFWLLVLPACVVTATAQNNAVQSEEQRVLSVEDEYVEAEVNRDEATLRRIVDDRFVYNRSDGTTSGKEELIEQVLSLNMTGQTISERTVVIEGETAVIFGTSELRFASDTGEDTKQILRYTSVYAKRQGAWRFLALHMSGRRN